ncbi:CaiB/BaiF CoA transferase family protein [Trinickia mobilis]|uniref:CaiB/BaiF CoA transferase family protein n=1 Tax=Trinickia mobilis TaxID=2816356 RepID=UPI001A90CB99|nr:CoA transferase [Trinickia mobilis]
MRLVTCDITTADDMRRRETLYRPVGTKLLIQGASMSEMPYSGLRVVEMGSRTAVGACGRLIADLGAEVYVVEPRSPRKDRPGKWRDRVSAVAGKHSILVDPDVPADIEAVNAIIDASDIVILSSDADDAFPSSWTIRIPERPIICDITAFGASGPLAGRYADEIELQALTGVLGTTGLTERPAVAVGVPVLEMSAALYAASGIGVAVHVLARDGFGQNVEVALFDVGVNSLTTFMPAHYAGLKPQRLGNGHGMAVPWNAYPAADGWILICTTNDTQWKRVAQLIGPNLTDDARFVTLTGRLAHRGEIDAAIAAWTNRLPLSDLADMLGQQGIPCGGILTISQLEREPNLAWRGTVREVDDPVSGRRVRVAGPLIRHDWGEVPTAMVPPPDSARLGRPEHDFLHFVDANPPIPFKSSENSINAPFAGLRVIEIGQLTTAPLTARHLASLGADVIKVEAPGGENARSWSPMRDGVSHFFVASNGQKRSVELDLRKKQDCDYLIDLLTEADVLVENMKPGALARLGFSPSRLLEINSKLIYCSISGFGAHSVYDGRPAVDTVIQAMSGMMDATRVEGRPIKAGISAADIAGGQTGLLAIIAGLARRDKTGRGSVIDISMQDVGAWMTQGLWNQAVEPRAYTCQAATIAEVCTHRQTIARELIVVGYDDAGRGWEVFGSPMRLSKTPARLGTLIGHPSSVHLTWAAGNDSHAERGAERVTKTP